MNGILNELILCDLYGTCVVSIFVFSFFFLKKKKKVFCELRPVCVFELTKHVSMFGTHSGSAAS